MSAQLKRPQINYNIHTSRTQIEVQHAEHLMIRNFFGKLFTDYS